MYFGLHTILLNEKVNAIQNPYYGYSKKELLTCSICECETFRLNSAKGRHCKSCSDKLLKIVYPPRDAQIPTSIQWSRSLQWFNHPGNGLQHQVVAHFSLNGSVRVEFQCFFNSFIHLFIYSFVHFMFF